MSNNALEKLKKDIERQIDKSVDYSELDKLRESVVRDINKMQRPNPWPEPPEEKTNEK